MTPSALEIAIVGSGPAGLSAALGLHHAGHSVKVYERLATPKALGSGLLIQPTGLTVLRHLGVEPALRTLGNPIDRLRGIAMPSRRIALDAGYDHDSAYSTGLAVHRGALFSVLHSAVTAAGIPIETGFELRSVTARRRGQRALVSTEAEQSGGYNLVVDASGMHSKLVAEKRAPLDFGALWATLDWHEPGPFRRTWLEQRYQRANIMVGVLPVGRIEASGPRKLTLFWSLPHRRYNAWLRRGLPRWKDEVRSVWPQLDNLLEQIDTPEQLTLAGYAHRTLARPFAPGVVHIGDAAHCTSPQLGQGANMALLDSAALVTALAQTASVDAALHRYAQLRRLHIYLYQSMSLGLTPAFQSHGRLLPWLRDTLMEPVSRLPLAQKLFTRTLTGMLGNPLKHLELSDRTEF